MIHQTGSDAILYLTIITSLFNCPIAWHTNISWRNFSQSIFITECWEQCANKANNYLYLARLNGCHLDVDDEGKLLMRLTFLLLGQGNNYQLHNLQLLDRQVSGGGGQLLLNRFITLSHTFSLYFRSCILGISELRFVTCLDEEEAWRWERRNQTKGQIDEEIMFIIFLLCELSQTSIKTKILPSSLIII